MRNDPLPQRLAHSFCRAARGSWQIFEAAQELCSADEVHTSPRDLFDLGQVQPAPPSGPASSVLEEQHIFRRSRAEHGPRAGRVLQLQAARVFAVRATEASGEGHAS